MSSSNLSQFSVKDKQIEVVTRMLNFNSQDSKSHWQDVWKVLVYDKYCGDIIALLLKKGELRNLGITLHLLLHSDRQSISDVPAVYFVMPNKDNIRRICEDCRANLYDNIYLDFASAIQRPLLEELASSTVQSESSHLICKVFDQYLNFLSLEKDLFVFNNPSQSYIAFNDPTLSDVQAEANLDTVVDSLFSVLITLEVVPIIRAAKNTAAELVARRLDSRLHQHLSSRPAFTSSDPNSGSSSYQRPVLIILDRNVDLTVMMHHPWTYQALVHDLLSMQLNRVAFQVQEESASGKPAKSITKHYDLDPAIDPFWSANAATPFPSVAAEIKTQINDYSATVERVNKLGIDIPETDDEKASLLESNAKGLGQLVGNISELTEQKRIIDMHTNVATALMKQIKDREIDAYFSYEEAIITKSFQDKKEMINLITSEGRGSAEDKMRLFLIYLMANKTIPASEMELLEEALTKAGADIAPIKYLKKTKAFNESLQATLNPPAASSTRSGLMSMITGAVTQSYQGYEPFERVAGIFTTSVRALLPKSKDLYVTRIVDALMETKNGLGVEDTYVYFDPKSQSRGGNITRKNTPFKDAIVFVVGGGNYVEYQNLLDSAKKQVGKRIIYGSTEMVTPHEFLQQLSELSKKSIS